MSGVKKSAGTRSDASRRGRTAPTRRAKGGKPAKVTKGSRPIKPKAAKPKAAKPKAARPKAARPKAAKPKAARPKAARPKAAKPKAAKPKAAPREILRIRDLDPYRKCGPGTSVERLIRVDELVNRRLQAHLVFLDRHGWYCEHGRSCPAVGHARRHAQHAARPEW